MKALAGCELVEAERQRGLGVDGLKRERAFEMNRHIGVNASGFADRGPHVDALRTRLPPDLVVLPQHPHALGGYFDPQTWHGPGEGIIAGVLLFSERSQR